MPTRRATLTSRACRTPWPACRSARAGRSRRPGASWAGEVPVIRIGLLGGENTADRLKRYDAFQQLLEVRFGVPVKLLPASDYAGVMQGFAAGQLEVAEFGACGFAGACLDCKCLEPIVVPPGNDGSTSYFSVIVTRADSGITTLAELKGHSLAWADPNSTSGYLIPRSTLKTQGIDLTPGNYFSTLGFSGGHEQGVVAVLNKQYDAAVTWTSGLGDESVGYRRGNLRSMVDKKMLDMAQLRIIWRSRPIENGPLTVRADTPQAFQDDMLALHLGLAKADPAVFQAINMGSGPGLVAVSQKDYEPFIDMLKAEAAARRRR